MLHYGMETMSATFEPHACLPDGSAQSICTFLQGERIEIPFRTNEKETRKKNIIITLAKFQCFICAVCILRQWFHDIIILCLALAFLHVFFVIWWSSATSSGIPVYYDNNVHRGNQTTVYLLHACFNIYIYTRDSVSFDFYRDLRGEIRHVSHARPRIFM